MKKHEATPAEKMVNWWKSNEEIEGLEQALNDESLVSEKSIVDTFLSAASRQPTASWQRTLLLVFGFIMGTLLLIGVGFIGWSLWRLPGSLPPPATPQPQSSSVQSQQLSQMQGELNDLARRMAAVEANQPLTGAVATLQTQVAELQRALTVTPSLAEVPVTPTFSPTQTFTSTPSVSLTQTLTPAAATSLSITPTVTPTTTQIRTPSPSMTPQGIEGKYQGQATPRTGPGRGSDGQGVYEASSAKLQPQIPVTVLGQWTQENNWLLVAASAPKHFFWVSDSVAYKGEAPAIALPWWKPTPAPDPWRESLIDDLFVYTMTITGTEPISLSMPARWEFTIDQDGEYAIEVWMPSKAGAQPTYRIETPQGQILDREVDQSALQGKPGFYEIGTYALSPGTLRISVVKVQAGRDGTTAAVGPIRLVRK